MLTKRGLVNHFVRAARAERCNASRMRAAFVSVALLVAGSGCAPEYEYVPVTVAVSPPAQPPTTTAYASTTTAPVDTYAPAYAYAGDPYYVAPYYYGGYSGGYSGPWYRGRRAGYVWRGGHGYGYGGHRYYGGYGGHYRGGFHGGGYRGGFHGGGFHGGGSRGGGGHR